MAHLTEEVLVIKISTLLPDQCDPTPIMDNETVAALREFVEQLAGNNKTLVEIERA